ncbi:MAG: DUF5115 domain-containing protein [Prevotella sp.]|nr:DUF5115 domain-containing protein [Prevotella sp.]
MKKLAYYVSLAITGLLMTACSEDFKDWAKQQTYGQEDAITIPGYTASAASATGIDLNAVEGEIVQLVSLNGGALPEGYSLSNVRMEIYPSELDGAQKTILNAVSSDGYFLKEDLQTAVVGYYGVRPTPRPFNAHVYVDAFKDGQAALIDAGEMNFELTPIAPTIEDVYYVTGNINGWKNDNTDYAVSNGGKDPYENPVYVVVIPAMSDGSNVEFKLTPKSGLGGDWSECIASDQQWGKFNYHNVGDNFVIPADGSAYYRVIFNMLDQTWEATPVPLIENAYYYVGAANGWGGQDYKMVNGGGDVYDDPVFTVTVPAQGGDHWFKIMPESAFSLGSIWDSPTVVGVYENGTSALEGMFIVDKNGNDQAGSGANAWCIKEGDNPADFYQITINMMNQTYTIKPIVIAAQYYVVGGVQGWSDKDKTCLFTPEGKNVLSYTTKWTGAWDLKVWDADGFGNWDVAWGCAVDGDNSPNGALINSGSQAISAPSAEFYTFTIDMNTQTYTWTKLDNQAPTEYESISLIGEFNGWGDDFDLTQVTPHNWYGVFTQESDGQLKYRANHDWSVNWGFGGDKDWNVAEEFNKIGTNGGGNIWVPAGTYAVYLNDITNSMLIVAQ